MRTLSTLALLVLASAGHAHYHMLLPDKPSANHGVRVNEWLVGIDETAPTNPVE